MLFNMHRAVIISFSENVNNTERYFCLSRIWVNRDKVELKDNAVSAKLSRIQGLAYNFTPRLVIGSACHLDRLELRLEAGNISHVTDNIRGLLNASKARSIFNM
ncbi:hypothetical protein F5Y14DRAFT_434834 [Nemania sp. NC0429]|nr:hypothetical protein F5Y14DRAFT_434834 [Nemania sp. NC0429]